MSRPVLVRMPVSAAVRRGVALAVAVAAALLPGCAAVSNPVGDAVPVRRLPAEVLGTRREEAKTIPLTLLRQRPPTAYLLAPGDTLGVWIEGVLGEKGQAPPIQVQSSSADSAGLPPAFGYPIPVRDDGTVFLPLIDPVRVEGLTVPQAQEEISKAYTVTRKVLQPGRERVLITLMRPRRYHVLVVRQDTGATEIGTNIGGNRGLIGQTKRGTGQVIDLPAYENDVLNALARTGGLPGLDAQNEVVIQRGSFADLAAMRDPQAVDQALGQGPGCPPGGPAEPGVGPDGAPSGPGVRSTWVRIPLRQAPGEPPTFRPEDVILYDGDIVFIEARDTEVFYTGGILPAAQWPLPRDYSIDVVEAVAFVGGQLVNGGLGGTGGGSSGVFGAAFAGQVTGGFGFPSPSLVTILRRTPGGGQIPIRIDMNKALHDPRERVLIQPGDIVILQETVAEAIARYITFAVRLDFFGRWLNRQDATGTGTIRFP